MEKGWDFGEIFDGDKFKTWARMFVHGWQGLKVIGIWIGVLEQKMQCLKNYRLSLQF